jgi:outer membrane protein assembly factor BamB
MRSRMLARSRVGFVLIAAAGLLAAACSSAPKPGPPAARPDASGSWPYPNADLNNTRVAPDSLITAANVSKLRQAWSFPITGAAASGVAGAGSLVAPPVVQHGVVYLQDMDCNVYAIALVTGKLKWEYHANTPEKTGPGPNGVAVESGVVYGDSPGAVFALNAASGKTLWIDRHLLSKGEGTFEIQPQAAGGRVYIASAYGSGPGGGVLMALNAASGALLWTFNTLLGSDQGVRAIGLGSGGAWQTPLVGTDGSVTFGIGNPYQSAGSAMADPSAQLYTDSDVSLDAATGKLRWYYQGVTNDFKDYDMQASPISATVGGTPVVLGAGKMGYVYEMDAKTGKLRWKTPVGQHNGHDSDSLLALQHKLTLKVPVTFEPGPVGGVLTDMAESDGTVYVGTIDLAFKLTKLSLPIPVVATGKPAGEVEALSLATGKVEWDTKVANMPLGAATVSNNLLFTTLYGGQLIAFNRATGQIVYRRTLPTSTNAPVAVAGNTLLVPAGGPTNPGGLSGSPQLVAYTVP